MIRQVVRAAFLDRDVYGGIFFDRYATANGVLIVGGIYLLAALRFLNAVSILRAVIYGLLAWVVLAGVMYLAGTKLYHGMAHFQRVIAASGYAMGPVVILAIGAFVRLGSVLVVGVAIWLVATQTVAARETMELQPRDAIATAVLGVAAWYIIGLIY